MPGETSKGVCPCCRISGFQRPHFGGHFNFLEGSYYERHGKWRSQTLLDTLGFDGTTLVVQKNDDIIEQADYVDTPLNDGDQIELVRFVGGG